MSVVGFDLGNASCKVGVARKRGVEVLQNEVGHRLTPSLVQFQGPQRMIGEAALPLYMSHFKDTLNLFRDFLGVPFDDPFLQEEIGELPYKLVKDESGGVLFEVNYDGKTQQFRPEQAMAAMMVQLKTMTEANLEGMRLSDCVIAVPDFWSDAQRRAILDASRIAGLNCLRLINETTAVALNYGLLRTLPPKGEPIKVMFVDMGYTSTHVSIVEFVEGKLTVLAHASEPTLGGRAFDRLLVHRIAKEVQERYNLDVWSDMKAQLKVWKEAERIKKVLSANQDVHWTIEYVMNETDVKGTLTREDFETMAKDQLDRLGAPIQKVLEVAKLTKKDLHSVEIVGGATRIPIVQSHISSIVGLQISKTCDSDESIARGSALQCAMLSPSFRVREFEVQDIVRYPINLRWSHEASMEVDAPPADDSCVLFPLGNPIPSVKQISFNYRPEPLLLEASFAKNKLDGSLPHGYESNQVVAKFRISGMPSEVPADNSKPPKIKIKLKVDLHNILDIASAQLIEEVIEEVVEIVPVKDEDSAKAADGAQDADKDAPKKDKAADAEDSESASKAEDGSQMEVDTPEPAEEEKPKTREVVRKKKKTRRSDLKIERIEFLGLSEAAISEFFEKEVAMSNQDRSIAATAAKRNELEAYVYEMRDAVETELGEFMIEDEKENYLTELTETEDWLYEDGEDAQKSEYIKKLDDLRAKGDPVKARKFELENREEYCARLKKVLEKYQIIAVSPPTSERYGHIAAEEKEKILACTREAETWMNNGMEKQKELPKSADPVITCAQLQERESKVAETCEPIANTPKPKPKEPEKSKEPEKEKQAEAQTSKDESMEPKEEAPTEESAKEEGAMEVDNEGA